MNQYYIAPAIDGLAADTGPAREGPASRLLADLAGNHLAAPFTWSFTARPPGSIRERLWSVP